ncbi:MAG: TolC family protein [Myxococcales bacterium]|nr:TolC family protein [Myxococcales bacterium]
MGFDLLRCLRLADLNHPNVQAARARVDQVKAQLLEAHFAPYMMFSLTGGIGLSATTRGTNVFSPNTDQSITSSMGLGWRTSFDGIIPLWTFGKITSLWDAAEANVRVNEAGVEVARDEVRYEVRRAYFGLQLARQALELLHDAEERIRKAEADLQHKVDNEDGDPIDLLKMQTHGSELEIKHSEAEKWISVAMAGLRFYTGIDRLEVPEEPLRLARHRLGHVSRYLQAARLHRPEMQMVRAGIEARQAQVRQSQAGMFPDIGIALSAGASVAPEVADQVNPFTGDPNYFHYGAGLVFQWKLDVVPQVARVEFAEAQLREMMALDRKALGGVAAEVEQAYAEVVDWGKRLGAYRKAAKYAKRWLVTVQQAIDVGTMEEKELLDPAKAYLEHRYNALNATMEYNLAMARLAKATGWDAIAPDAR